MRISMAERSRAFQPPFAVGALCVVLLAGCGREGDFPTATTTGRVICEGKPVPHVMVFFEPLQAGKAALVGKQGFAYADAEGKFTISTYGNEDGAVVGRHRVRVGPPHAEDYPNYKCDCVLNSEVDMTEVEIKHGEKNEFELVLKKKTGREPKPLPDDSALAVDPLCDTAQRWPTFWLSARLLEFFTLSS